MKKGDRVLNTRTGEIINVVTDDEEVLKRAEAHPEFKVIK